MKTLTTDTQLEYELQDLYIASKHWLSDIAFATDEIRFFNDVISKYFTVGFDNSQHTKFNHCKMMLFQREFDIINLKNNVTAYLNFLSPFIMDNEQKIGVDLIETHTLLECETAALFESVKALKQEVFMLAAEAIDAQKNLFI